MRKRWTKEEDKELLEIILRFVTEGNSVRESVKMASDEVKRSFESCYARWNNFLRIEHEELLEQAKFYAKENGNIFYEKWTEEDDNQLTDLVLDEVSKGISTRKAIDKISKKINRSFNSCYNRWQNVLSKNFENKIIHKSLDYSEYESSLDELTAKELKERVNSLETKFEEVYEQNKRIISLINNLIINK